VSAASERGIQVNKTSAFRVDHALLERFGYPRIVILRDKLGDLRAFAGGQRLLGTLKSGDCGT